MILSILKSFAIRRVLPIVARLLSLLVGFIFWRVSRRKFGNRDVLFQILKRNRDTAFIREAAPALQHVKTVEEYKQSHPLTTYANYRPFVDRIASTDEINVMSRGRPVFLATTSGTTAVRKLFPKYMPRIWAMITFYFDYQGTGHLGFLRDSTVLLQSLAAPTEFTPNALPIQVVSSAGFRLGASVTIGPASVTPLAALENFTNFKDLLLVNLLFALHCKTLKIVRAVFISTVLDFFMTLEQNFDLLVTCVETGSFLPRSILNGKNVPDEVMTALSTRCKPNPTRAAEIRKAASPGAGRFIGISGRIWPNMKSVWGITGVSFKSYEEKLRSRYLSPDVRIWTTVYGSSEGMFGAPYVYDKPEYILMPSVAFYEFIEEDQLTAENPRTLEMHELKLGETYELVVTTFDGLYRYRMSDLLKVVGWKNFVPIVVICGRREMALRLGNEITTEMEIRMAVEESISVLPGAIHSVPLFCVISDLSVSPARYGFFVELEQEANLPTTPNDRSDVERLSGLASQLAQSIDSRLREINYMYDFTRKAGRISNVAVTFVRWGTFEEITAVRSKGFQGPITAQLKMPLVVTDNVPVRDILTQRTIVTSSF